MIHTDTRGSLDQLNVAFLRCSTTEHAMLFLSMIPHSGRSSQFSMLLETGYLATVLTVMDTSGPSDVLKHNDYVRMLR